MPKVQSNGIGIFYETFGAGEPLLLITGTGGDSRYWMPLVESGQNRYQCLLPYNRGTGLSDWPVPPYTVPQMADDMVGLLDALDIPRAHIAGHSLGSAIGQELAIRYPHRVHTLLLLSTWDQTAAYPHLRWQFEMRKSLLERNEPELYLTLSNLYLFSPAFVNRYSDLMLERKRELLNILTPERVRTLIGHLEADLTHDTANQLSQIEVPTLILVGEYDTITWPDYSHNVQAQIPGAELMVLKDAAHMLLNEVPEALNQAVYSFLKRYPL
jgi:pimeloyl-ACP methyl ester carboxylesterase